MWLDRPGFERRPLVVVEDHLYHTTELVEALAAARPDLVAQTTAVVLDRPGPDTDAGMREWRERFPALLVRAPDALELADAPSLARAIARLLRPGGLVVQDVQLSTLPFLPADRWWESIYLAATVRGLFADRAPTVRFLSNKRGYEATFGRDLLEAGFDPRDVMDKSTLPDTVVPTITAFIDREFPYEARARDREGGVTRWLVGRSEAERDELSAALDAVLWLGPAGHSLAGRAVAAGTLLVRGGEADSWRLLIDDLLSGGPGLTVVDVGRRVGPPDAGRAELTNVAARHVHTLRSRLADPAAILTQDHAYRLAPGFRAGIVSARPAPAGAAPSPAFADGRRVPKVPQ
jgi:hypothetical protein